MSQTSSQTSSSSAGHISAFTLAACTSVLRAFPIMASIKLMILIVCARNQICWPQSNTKLPGYPLAACRLLPCTNGSPHSRHMSCKSLWCRCRTHGAAGFSSAALQGSGAARGARTGAPRRPSLSAPGLPWRGAQKRAHRRARGHSASAGTLQRAARWQAHTGCTAGRLPGRSCPTAQVVPCTPGPSLHARCG